MLAKTARQFTKPRKTYKRVIEPHRIKDLETFLRALERHSDDCKREGIQRMSVTECIEVLRHR